MSKNERQQNNVTSFENETFKIFEFDIFCKISVWWWELDSSSEMYGYCVQGRFYDSKWIILNFGVKTIKEIIKICMKVI